jgi:site-specific recombinase XerD
MGLSEVLHLERKDLNLDQPSLTVRETKFKKSRLLPIHRTTANALAVYLNATLATLRCSVVETLFITSDGRPIPKRTVHNVFEGLRHRLGWVCVATTQRALHGCLNISLKNTNSSAIPTAKTIQD